MSLLIVDDGRAHHVHCNSCLFLSPILNEQQRGMVVMRTSCLLGCLDAPVTVDDWYWTNIVVAQQLVVLPSALRVIG